jgi:hypothetical protein
LQYPINLFVTFSLSFWFQVGRIGKLAMLSVMTIAMVLFQPVQANNEIVNFGPILCKADEVGHLEDKAARQVSRGW